MPGTACEILQNEDIFTLVLRNVQSRHAGQYEIQLRYVCCEKEGCSLWPISYIYPQVKIPAWRKQEFHPVQVKHSGTKGTEYFWGMKRTNKAPREKRKHKKSQKKKDKAVWFPFGILKHKALWQQYGKQFLARKTTISVLSLDLLFIMFGISLGICKDVSFHGNNLSREGCCTKSIPLRKKSISWTCLKCLNF